MKILIISFYFEPDLSAGSFRTNALVTSLLEQLSNDSHIDVITTLPNRYSSFKKEALEYETRTRLNVHRIAVVDHNNGMIGQSNAFVKFARGAVHLSKINKNYDIVFATSSRLMTAALGAYISRKIKKPLYLDIRDIFVDSIKDVLPKKIGWLMKLVFSFIEDWTIHSAMKVNLVS